MIYVLETWYQKIRRKKYKQVRLEVSTFWVFRIVCTFLSTFTSCKIWNSFIIIDLPRYFKQKYFQKWIILKFIERSKYLTDCIHTIYVESMLGEFSIPECSASTKFKIVMTINANLHISLNKTLTSFSALKRWIFNLKAASHCLVYVVYVAWLRHLHFGNLKNSIIKGLKPLNNLQLKENYITGQWRERLQYIMNESCQSSKYWKKGS